MGTHEAAVAYRNDTEHNAVHVTIHDSPSKKRKKGATLLKPSAAKKSSWLPILFDRASGSWWNPKFDSKILESQHWNSAFPQAKRRFRYALFYIILSAVAWCVYFGVTSDHERDTQWIGIVIGSSLLAFITVGVLVFTYTRYYRRYYLYTSVCVVLLLCALSLGIRVPGDRPNIISSVGGFTIMLEILLLMYTVFPMPLHFCTLIGVFYSCLSEAMSVYVFADYSADVVVCTVLLHLCIHIIGIHIFIMSQVRTRSTFWKVCQSIVSRRELEIERQLKEKMIHSVMPPKVADDLMKSSGDDIILEVGKRRPSSPRNNKVSKAPSKPQLVFRPFNMHRMEDVSILFADIVGFTKMSSNKMAETLVGLLNDLFGRFDKLCEACGCEKISTLGDCYYCVAGCPEPIDDHAKCAVEMGLAMIKAIKQFDEDNNEEVNMRVGVHTGTVLCGIVGTRRFKFDVWSNDVTFANMMESSGKPGRVHISEVTYKYLDNMYEVEAGETQDGEFR
ncbi:PREDICTED: adenylate cyclase type 9-like [Priapulus caudatus]|uniref:adenylate cyclase n=1 Tax=Priapulus caudatus TaxID=37621 RepID=A0ABM1E988_PRICU|nr:PREDICTED: adenylate cyclase type 9-like [Priapulus caudatus]